MEEPGVATAAAVSALAAERFAVLGKHGENGESGKPGALHEES